MAFIIIILLILLNAYFSFAEIALITVRRDQLADAEAGGSGAAAQALRLTRDPEVFLSVVQVGITLLSLLEGIYGGDLVAARLQPLLEHAGIHSWVARGSSLVIGIGLITYLTIVIGELLPKSIALQAPLKVALFVAPSLVLFSRLTAPFIRLLTWSTRLLLRALHVETGRQQKLSEADLRRMLGMAYQQGILEKEELWLHQNIFFFSELTAGRIMKPFALVRFVERQWSEEQVEALMREYPYSHFPVLQNGCVGGMLSIKMLCLHRKAQWQDAIEPVITVPESREAGDLFNQFKEARSKFAVVTDGTGKPVGIVTMQDIMEGVFGDIPELENYGAYFYRIAEKRWQAHGLIHLQRIRRVLGLEWLRDYEIHYLTLGELLAGELGRRPVKGDTLKLHDVRFRVASGDAGRITIEL